MEMMVVLLIVAIIAAASAPMVTKKLSRNTGTGDSPWVFTGLNNSIAYNMSGSDNSTVLIGTSTLPNNLEDAVRLYIDSGNNAAHIAFGNGAEEPLLLTADPALGRIGFSNASLTSGTIAFGIDQTIDADALQGVAIGTGAELLSNHDIAIGVNASSQGVRSIAIGSATPTDARPNTTSTDGYDSIAIGTGARVFGDGTHDAIAQGRDTEATDPFAIAIGSRAAANGTQSIAIGGTSDNYRSGNTDLSEADKNSLNMTLASRSGCISIGQGALSTMNWATAIGTDSLASEESAVAIGIQASARHKWSVAIGATAKTSADNQIVLGTANETVYIPGKLVVGQQSYLGTAVTDGHSSLWLRAHDDGGSFRCGWVADKDGSGMHFSEKKEYYNVAPPVDRNAYYSDEQLKNVGEEYTAGLAELKKLDFFHYTFKEDKEKTPHVGVIAQDLEKVFPDAVTKGEDGYLRIRWEDMFYAMINAVKELDNKIIEIVQNITEINSTIEKQNQTISEQAKIIEEQNTRLEELEELNGKQTKMLETQSRDIDNLIKRIEKLEGK